LCIRTTVEMPTKRTASPEIVLKPDAIFTSQQIHDRNSIFVAHFSPHPGVTPKQLQSLPEGKSASHRILAWRLPSKQRTLTAVPKPIFDKGHDDDGEQWAGKKLENLLEELDITGAVVVYRWYGGVLLGPVRFKHIEDVAKEAVNVWKHQTRGGGGKRQRTVENTPMISGTPVRNETMRPEELAKRKSELVRTLQRRDESISTLRILLEQKKSASDSRSKDPSIAVPSGSSPARKIDYESMLFPRLLALEQARDASIAFLLKEIDKAEQIQAEKEKEEAEQKKKINMVKTAQEEEDIEDAWTELEASMLQTDPTNQSTE